MRILVSLFLLFILGCTVTVDDSSKKTPDKVDVPQDSGTVFSTLDLTESSSGGRWNLKKGSEITLRLTPVSVQDSFWSIYDLPSGIQILQVDNVEGSNYDLVKLKISDSGEFKISRVRFSDMGSVDLKKLVYTFNVK